MLRVIILSLFLASLSPKPTDTTDLEDTWAFKTSGKAIPVFSTCSYYEEWSVVAHSTTRRAGENVSLTRQTSWWHFPLTNYIPCRLITEIRRKLIDTANINCVTIPAYLENYVARNSEELRVRKN